MEIRTPEPEAPVAPMARSEMPDAGINAANEPGSAGIKPNELANKRAPASSRLP